MRNNMTRRAWLQSSTAALACLALPEYALGAAAEKNGASRVWMTKEISPEALVRIYEALGRPATGKAAVKISTGEPGGRNFLRGNCVFGNDIFQELYDKMVKADAIILGSSTYSADVSSTLKAVIERASVVSDTNPGMFRHKVGGAVAVARRAGAMNAIDTINHFFLNKEMFVAGSTYWNIAYGRLPGEAMKDEEAVANMKNLGQNIAWLLGRLK